MMAAGGVYVSTAYLAYYYSKQEREEAAPTPPNIGCSCHGSISYVKNSSFRNSQYEKLSPDYDNKIHWDEFFLGIPLLRRFLLSTHARGTVLEVGAGTGRNIPYYLRLLSDSQKKVHRVLLQDQSLGMLAQAQQKIDVHNKPHQPPAIVCLPPAEYPNAEHLKQLPSKAFDTVVDTFGLCSYDDPVAVLNEMARLCRGKILLLEHGRSKTWPLVTKHLDKTAEKHAKTWGCVWNRDLDEIIQQSNVEVISLDTYHFGTTYYVVCRPKPGPATQQERCLNRLKQS
jgi:methyltransferase OMS1, mitochondrial